MKFSYNLLKKYLPELESKEQAIEALAMYSFETEDKGENTIDVSVSINRYSDGASHIGIAKELAVVLGLDDSNIPELVVDSSKLKGNGEMPIIVETKEKDLCPRYLAGYFENIKVEPSPEWLQEILKDCGLRPINNIVDIMNYTMLETGQPLHAFDFEKINDQKIIIRNAKDKEDFVSIDDNHFELDSSILTIADSKEPMAIAGIKGGSNSAVSDSTSKIIVEAASFDGVLIYKTSKKIALDTDASIRFVHDIHPSLLVAGIARAKELLEEIVGANFVASYDSNKQEYTNRHLSFDLEDFNKFIGTEVKLNTVKEKLNKLGFAWENEKVTIPILRQDINHKEDLYEEVVRLIGFNDLEAKPPLVGIQTQKTDDIFLFKDKIRSILSGFGFSEVYNYSFIDADGEDKVKIANPVSEEKDHLRDSLLPLILSNVESNFRFQDEVRVFEIGNIFEKDKNNGVYERPVIGIGVGINKDNKESFFELKGVLEVFFEKLGLTDYLFPEEDDFHGLKIEADGKVIGQAVRVNKNIAVAQIEANDLLETVEGEISYAPLPQYPAVSRDISLVVGPKIRIGNIIEEIQNNNLELIQDVDLIDEYFGEDNIRQSITFRIIFQSKEKTLESSEVNKEMKKIIFLLKKKFKAEVK